MLAARPGVDLAQTNAGERSALELFRTMISISGCLFLVALTGAPGLSAQVITSVERVEMDTSLAAIVGLARKGWENYRKEMIEVERRDPEAARAVVEPMGIGRFLLQMDGPQPQWKLEALADSLVVIALEATWNPRESGPGDVERRDAASSVVKALFVAWIGSQGKPFPGAFDRLVRIVEEGRHPGIRAGALKALISNTPEPERSITYLRKLITTNHPMAMLALQQLMTYVRFEESGAYPYAHLLPDYPPDFTPYASALLRELYEKDMIKDPDAKFHLEQFAKLKGWQQS